jgi:hypothetical protein
VMWPAGMGMRGRMKGHAAGLEGGPALLVDAWSGSPCVDAVVTALVLAASRRSVSAPSHDRTDRSATRGVRACGDYQVSASPGETPALDVDAVLRSSTASAVGRRSPAEARHSSENGSDGSALLQSSDAIGSEQCHDSSCALLAAVAGNGPSHCSGFTGSSSCIGSTEQRLDLPYRDLPGLVWPCQRSRLYS